MGLDMEKFEPKQGKTLAFGLSNHTISTTRYIKYLYPIPTAPSASESLSFSTHSPLRHLIESRSEYRAQIKTNKSTSQMKPILVASILVPLSATVASATLVLGDSFLDSPSANLPTGWISDDANPVNNHGYVAAGSLSYPGLEASTENSFGLGDKTADYSITFTPLDPAVGDTVYLSFLMQINSPLDPFGAATGFNVRVLDSTDIHGSGISVGWGSADDTSNLMGFSINNRQRGYSHADSIKTDEIYTAADTTYFVVASYTRGASRTSGTVDLWINPDSATFGTGTSPDPTLSMATYQDDEIFDTLSIGSAGSGQYPPDWQIDELRIATTWAEVAPAGLASIPEPASMMALLGLSTFVLAAIKRRRR